MSNLSVFSEIGRLRAVAVHNPGLEVDYMTPSLMHELLFDDILFGEEAREEHALFRKVLGKVADQVIDVQLLLEQALAVEGAKPHFLERFCALHNLSKEDAAYLGDLDAETLAKIAVTGWYEDLDKGADYRFKFPPVPNLLFMRDPASVIGDGVSINHMATAARRPEPFILEVILRFHPEYAVESEEKVWFNAIPGYMKGQPEANHTIEGGDILVISEDVLAVGVSIRTTQSAVTMLAESVRKHHKFKTLIGVLMPQERAVMHLDTIFTRIDEEHCLCFPPFFGLTKSHSLPVIKMDLTADVLQVELKDNFLLALRGEGVDLKPISCGGLNRLDQEREQWTDGANAFCLAPGVILGYSRNLKTSDELARHGYNIISAQEAVKPEVNLLDGRKYFIAIPGNELSRARGGPRCMTMPLRRDA
jgi:arginine deiminase